MEPSVAEKEKFRFSLRHLVIIGVLALAFSISFVIRSQPIEYGFELNEFDPFFNYRATEFIVNNGLAEYFSWHDDRSWHPQGRNVSATSQAMLHITAAMTYQTFGGDSPLYDFTILFPVIFGSLTTIVVFALVRVIGGTLSGLFASLLFSVSVPVLMRGTLGWFKSEPLGLFYGLLGTYLILSGIKSGNHKIASGKIIGSGILLAFGLASWGGNQFFIIPLGAFFLALPFLRSDYRFQIWAIPTFTVSFVLTVLAFERPGMGFVTGIGGFAIIGPTVFLVICNFVQLASKDHAFRNGLLLLAGTLATGTAVIAASFSSNILSIPSFRYLNAINPFLTTSNPLVDSVSEHATTTLAHSFFFHSVLMIFAGLGVWIILHKSPPLNSKNTDMFGFSLILGIAGVYISSAFIRLELFASVGIIILASVGLSKIFMVAFKEKNPGMVTKSALAGGIFVLLFSPLVLPAQGNWIDAGAFPPVILNGGTQFGVTSNDWPAALYWISANTPQDSVIAAWWDYGYWITTVSDRKTLADNATLDSQRIQDIARAFLSSPDDSWRQLRGMGADYVVVFVSSSLVQTDSIPLYQLTGGGDESKKHWFIRIAEEPTSKYLYADQFSGTPHFWDNTMLGKVIPYAPLIYYDEDARQDYASWQPGTTGLYVKEVKYPSDGDGPFRLAYASPSYVQESPVSIGVFVYEINKDYVP